MNKFLTTRPLIGGALNAFFPGIVYLFVGKRNKFGALLILASAFTLFSSSFQAKEQVFDAFTTFSVIFILLAFGIDGYNECKDAKEPVNDKEKK